MDDRIGRLVAITGADRAAAEQADGLILLDAAPHTRVRATWAGAYRPAPQASLFSSDGRTGKFPDSSLDSTAARLSAAALAIHVYRRSFEGKARSVPFARIPALAGLGNAL